MPETLVVKRVVLADDHPLFRTALESLLRSSTRFAFEVVGRADTGKACLAAVRRRNPDLLILDLNMPEMDGLEVLQALDGRWSALKVMVLTAYDDCKLVKKAFSLGADAYILKTAQADDILRAAERVLEGETVLGEGVRLVNEGAPERRRALQSSGARAANGTFMDPFLRKQMLTKRELEVLRLISQAMSNKEIARKLFISDQTVSVHRKNIMRKLGVSNTAGLLKTAYENCLI